MKFMMIVKATEDSEAGNPPSPERWGEGQIELRQVFEGTELTDDVKMLAAHKALSEELKQRNQP
ncbi:hypothetical protein PAECIP112173_02429 [Paenibacillus sp. JJ-100]|uniref:hypothetical protein n=1 Tax=Paenibacillus sp. JJ-100 TaxID=2974896 RepID=UPI0022FFB105|nr:hypothetical protein [Paenibacillus sp. JJ-100]CAI6076495.1 hypothetical protein PAECIP112173_02429 [Paenibacillus sp. JJ-100]